MIKKILITETQLENIIELYNKNKVKILAKRQINNFSKSKLHEQDPKLDITVSTDYSATPPPVEFEDKSEDGFTEKVNFQAGYHSQEYMKSDNLVKQLNSIINTISKSPDFKYNQGFGARYTLKITTYAGESQIPNVDYENQTKILSPGELAKMRQTTIDEFIRTYISTNLPKLGTPQGESIIKYETIQTKPTIGTTEWVGSFFCKNQSEIRGTCVSNYFTGLKQCGIIKGKNPSVGTAGPNCDKRFIEYHKKYEDEQYIRVTVQLIKINKDKVMGLPPLKVTSIKTPENFKVPVPEFAKCLREFTIDINYDRSGHVCNAGIYQVYLNGELISRNDGKLYSSLNNDGLIDNAGAKYTNGMIVSNDHGGFRYNKMVVTSNQIDAIVSKTKKELELKFVCRNLFQYLKPEDIAKYMDGKNVITKAGTFRLGNNEWIHKRWKNGCHESVGDIKLSNAAGDKYVIKNFRTPTAKDGEVIVLLKDPCNFNTSTVVVQKSEDK